MKKIVLLMAFALTACGEVDQSREMREAKAKSEYNEFYLTKLFTENGCDVYRFHDRGNYRYFTTCTGHVSSSHNVNQGKTSRTEYDEISTSRKDD